MPQEAIFDIRQLQEITEGNPEIERELAGLYMKTVESCLDRLQALSVRDEKDEWPNVMHELKGASLNIRAARMGAACREYMDVPMEKAAREFAIDALRKSYEQLLPMLNQLVQPK